MLCEASCTLLTEAGMHALWAPEPFADLHDDDTWDAELGDDADIQRHVVAGDLVPINIGAGGAASFVVRVGDRGSRPGSANARPDTSWSPPSPTS